MPDLKKQSLQDTTPQIAANVNAFNTPFNIIDHDARMKSFNPLWHGWTLQETKSYMTAAVHACTHTRHGVLDTVRCDVVVANARKLLEDRNHFSMEEHRIKLCISTARSRIEPPVIVQRALRIANYPTVAKLIAYMEIECSRQSRTDSEQWKRTLTTMKDAVRNHTPVNELYRSQYGVAAVMASNYVNQHASVQPLEAIHNEQEYTGSVGGPGVGYRGVHALVRRPVHTEREPKTRTRYDERLEWLCLLTFSVQNAARALVLSGCDLDRAEDLLCKWHSEDTYAEVATGNCDEIGDDSTSSADD